MSRDPCRGKVRFASWDAAQLALVNAKIARALRRKPTKRGEQRAYYCGNCNGFHLTSRPTWTPIPDGGKAR